MSKPNGVSGAVLSPAVSCASSWSARQHRVYMA
jgi:hypothetical protein